MSDYVSYRDAPDLLATPQMIEAGRDALLSTAIMFPVSELGESEQRQLVKDIYSAMVSRKP